MVEFLPNVISVNRFNTLALSFKFNPVPGPSWSGSALTIHGDSDIGLQPGGIERSADVQAPILHGDIFNSQAAANFVHDITLVHRSLRLRVLGVTKKSKKAKSIINWIIVFPLSE